MSVAFEYGGIDREFVIWTDHRKPESERFDNAKEKSTSSGDSEALQGHLDIDLMLITQ